MFQFVNENHKLKHLKLEELEKFYLHKSCTANSSEYLFGSKKPPIKCNSKCPSVSAKLTLKSSIFLIIVSIDSSKAEPSK